MKIQTNQTYQFVSPGELKSLQNIKNTLGITLISEHAQILRDEAENYFIFTEKDLYSILFAEMGYLGLGARVRLGAGTIAKLPIKNFHLFLQIPPEKIHDILRHAPPKVHT